MYDIIGDVHGYSQPLENLLRAMGYKYTTKGYVHSNRIALFVGDLVDRGPDVMGCLEIVKQMVDNGAALAIVGNHEFNVLAYYTKDELGRPLREHNLKNRTQIQRTRQEFKQDKSLKRRYLKWLRSLPLFLELDGLRLVHASWDDKAVELLSQTNPENRLSKSFLRRIHNTGGKEYEAVMLLLKGREFNLPDDITLRDSYGFKRSCFRIKWWKPMEGESFQTIAFGNRFVLPAYTIPLEICYPIETYKTNEPPVFFGHYCLNGEAGVVEPNLCCIDGCVANGGSLLAYRWDGEQILNPGNIFLTPTQ